MFNWQSKQQSRVSPIDRRLILLKQFYNEGAILLDVRTTSEFEQNSLPFAKHISSEELVKYIGEIESWNKKIIPFSNHGNRSEIAANLLQSEDLEAIDGGALSGLKVLLFSKWGMI